MLTFLIGVGSCGDVVVVEYGWEQAVAVPTENVEAVLAKLAALRSGPN